MVARSKVFVSLFLLTLSAVRAETPQQQTEHGRLSEFEGIPVLELWGTREQSAFAHGYLMAPRIMPLLENYMLSNVVLPDISVYTSVILPSIRVRWDWSPYQAEMDALYAGMKKRLGEQALFSKKLDRLITVDDLMACNAIPDWHGLFCSSFTAWGDLTTDGQTITARNLDYDYTPEMACSQFILVQHGDASRQSFVAVTWPGLLGAFTSVNADGVSLLSHDANSLPKSNVTGFTPRGFIFREALEKARASTAFDDVAAVFRARRVICGNNQHVSVPARPGQIPARIFEYDAATEIASGVTIRSDSGKAGMTVPALYCTNHVCVRQAPEPCHRYATLERELTRLALERKRLDWKSAMSTVREAAGKSTLHTVVIEPNEGMIHVLIPSIKDRPVSVPFQDWLRQRGTAGSR